MNYELRDYQEEGKEDFGNFMFNSAHKRGLAIKPTGTGKALDTAIISQLSGNPTLVIQPNIDLLEQNLEKAHAFGLDPSVYSASAGTKDISDLTYATPLSMEANPEHFRRFKTVVIDEAHLAMSNSMKAGKISKKGNFNQLMEYINPDKAIGLTASPIQLVTTGRGSELKCLNRSMRSFWYKSEIFSVIQIPDIKEKYWADITTDIINTDDSMLEKARYNSPEFTKESIIEQYDANNLEYQILEQYERLMSQGIDSMLTFVPSVEQAKQIQQKNKDFAFVYQKTPRKERKAIIAAFKRGDIPNLLNCMVFTAGFDHPGLKALLMARETMSFQLFYQIYGRLVRNIYEDGVLKKKKGLLVDFTGNTKRFGDISNLTFEKNDYTNGWGMWNHDKLLTGYPFGEWDMPSRQSLIDKYNSSGIISKDEKIEDITVKIGKYKGKKLIESFKKDTRYFMWMFTNFDWKSPYNKSLYLPLKQLIDKNTFHGD
jgi:superfamily II DNA or RNA helicase